MDRKNHPTKSLLSTWCLVSLCALFCLLAGCEEGMVDGPEIAAAPDMTETPGADLEAVAKAVENTFAEADTLEPEDVAGREEVVAIAEESATPDPVVAILADTFDTEPETLTEEQALADLEKEFGLKDPIPTKGAELTPDQANSETLLDKIHIADALLLAANGKTIEGQEEIQESEQGAKSKGFVDKVFVTPGSTVLKFAGRHFMIVGVAVFCVVVWIAVKKKKLRPAGPRRRTNSHE